MRSSAPLDAGRPLAPDAAVLVAVRNISGVLCVEALERAGFAIQHQNDGITVLSRGYRAVVVPMLAELPSTSINTVLNAAGLCYGDFVLLLEGQTASEIGRTRSGMRPRSAPPGDPADEG